MEVTTQKLLRKAAIEALTVDDDSAAIEILSLLHNRPLREISAAEAVNELPAGRLLIEGEPPHNYHYWAALIREQFIPFLHENGRQRFTSHELFAWIENHPAVTFTDGDCGVASNGSTPWRNIASNALSALKRQGVLWAAPWSKDYEIK